MSTTEIEDIPTQTPVEHLTEVLRREDTSQWEKVDAVKSAVDDAAAGGGVSGLQEVIDAPQYHADEISLAWQKSVEGILDTGRKLIAAKAELGHGRFLRIFADHEQPVERPVPFGRRTAQQLAAVAGDPRLANANHGSYLPPSCR